MTVDVGEAQSGVFTQVIPRPPPWGVKWYYARAEHNSQRAAD